MDSCHVLLRQKDMVSPVQWAEAILKEGFNLEIDTSYELDDDNGVFGYRPCKLNQTDVGFELSYISRHEDPDWFDEWDDCFEEAYQYDFCVSLSLCDESPAVLIAGAVLAKITGGVYFDIDEPMDTDDALEMARDAVTEQP